MADGSKKIAEIVEILGVDEAECRFIADEYSVILPCKKIGKVSIYDDNSVDRFRKIADLRTQGVPKEVIIPAIRGGKSLELRAREDLIKMGLVPEEKKTSEPKQIPRTETEEELILAVRSAESSVNTVDHRLAAMREDIDLKNKSVLDAIAGVSAEVAELKNQVHTLWDQIAELEEFLREANKPFWKK